MRVLVTGATGFFGLNLIPVLQAAGHEVFATDSRQSRVLEEIGFSGVAQLGVDLRSPGAADRVVRGMDAVVHLAALPGVMPSIEDPTTTFGVNVFGTFNILEAARKTLLNDSQPSCLRVILASTGSAADPTNPYAASKAAGEAYCRAYSASMGLEAVVLRFTNLYGPWSARKGSLVSALVRKAQAGQMITIDGDGSQERDFIHAVDAAEAIAAALQAGDWIGGQVLTIGSGVSTSVNDILDAVLVLGDVADIEVQAENGPARPTPEAVVDVDAVAKARDLLGWAPRHTIEDGVKTVWNWFLTRQDLVEEPESTGIGSCELITALDMGGGLQRIDFRDCRGKKRRKDVSRKGLVNWLRNLKRTQETAPESEQHNHTVAIEEAEWLISLFPEEDHGEAQTEVEAQAPAQAETTALNDDEERQP